MKELKANNDDTLPDWLDGLISIYEQPSIRAKIRTEIPTFLVIIISIVPNCFAHTGSADHQHMHVVGIYQRRSFSADLTTSTMPWGRVFPLAVGCFPFFAACRHTSGVQGTWW